MSVAFTPPLPLYSPPRLFRSFTSARPHHRIRSNCTHPVMSSMIALHQKTYGDLSTFQLGTVPSPSPSESQLLISVHAASLNPVDYKRGTRQIGDEKPPIITGYDAAGVVEAVGSKVSKFKAGDRVVADIQAVSRGPKTSGSVAEWCVCDENLAVEIPDDVSFVDAAALPVAACTAAQAFDLGGLKEGDRVFISGGAGGVGIHAIQIAKIMFGATEVATTASGEKMAFVKEYGADVVVDYKKEDAGEVLKGWADMVLDCTAEADMAKKVVKEGGKVVSVAAFGVEGVISFPLEPGAELMGRVIEGVKKGVKPVVDRVYALEEAVEAMQYLAGGRAKGKVIVKIRD